MDPELFELKHIEVTFYKFGNAGQILRPRALLRLCCISDRLAAASGLVGIVLHGCC